MFSYTTSDQDPLWRFVYDGQIVVSWLRVYQYEFFEPGD